MEYMQQETGRQNMPATIVFATSNEDKMKEVRMILADWNREVLSMKAAGVRAEIDEDGSTFEENALIKARAVHAVCGGLVLADDSGLEVDALDGAPGIHSARFMGEDTSYEIKNRAIIEQVNRTPEKGRGARFVCAIGAVLPDGTELTARACVEGSITHVPAGTGGFGYDPIFFVEELGKTTAELTAEEKNRVSHRGRALRAMKASLDQVWGKTLP